MLAFPVVEKQVVDKTAQVEGGKAAMSNYPSLIFISLKSEGKKNPLGNNALFIEEGQGRYIKSQMLLLLENYFALLLVQVGWLP